MIKVDAGSIRTTLAGLENVNGRLFEALRIISHSASQQMQAYAQANAKWIDRTGNARQKLKGDAYWKNSKVLETVIVHQMDYGVWLELAMGKKYAILDEAMQSAAPELIRQYKRLVED